MIILYGNNDIYKDVTEYFINNERIIIPYTDIERANICGFDPLPGILKIIKIEDDYNNSQIIKDFESIILDKDENNKYNLNNNNTNNNHKELLLYNIHNQITINHGNKYDEYEEQIMSVIYIKPDDCVLELGGNIGRNSCVISKILNNSENLLVIEPDPINAKHLEENKNINSLNFKIEVAAISKTPLILKGWDSRPITNTDNIPDGWNLINTINWEDLKNKYNMNFNVLVVDCEGALYYILKDEPNFLNNFKTIIIENDFIDINHKIFVDEEFKRFNFKKIYIKSGGFGPCYNYFYEVWKKL